MTADLNQSSNAIAFHRIAVSASAPCTDESGAVWNTKRKEDCLCFGVLHHIL